MLSQAGYGVYAERGRLAAQRLQVVGVGENDPGGVYAHGMSEVTLEDCEVNDVFGVGIQVYDAVAVSIARCVVDRVVASALSAHGGTAPRGAGDGIVVRPRVADATVSLEGNVVRDVQRFGIAVDGGALTLDGNVAPSTVATASTTVTGDPAASLDLAATPLGREQNPGEGPADFRRPMPR